MKTRSKEEIKNVAADIFKRYNKAQKVAVTSDGMAFITDESENAVLNHSRRNRSGKELAITRFNRADFDEKAKSTDELIAEIKEAAAETVQVILDAEKTGKKRKTVIAAAEARLKELKNGE